MRTTLPGVDLSDPTWAVLDGPTWSIELLIGGDDPVDQLGLLVRGTGDDVMTPIFALCTAFGCVAEDTTQGELLSGPEDTAGWHTFQHFRDLLTGGLP